MYRNLRHAVEIIKGFLIYWKPLEKQGNGWPRSWAGDTDWRLFWGLHSCSLSLGNIGDACLTPAWVCPDCVQQQCYKKWYRLKIWVHFAVLLLLSGRSEKWLFSEIKTTPFNSFASEEMDLESCVNFLSTVSKINWISGEKASARWKDREYSVGIVKQLSQCKEITSTDEEGSFIRSALFITVTNYLEKQELNEVTKFADTTELFKVTETNTDNKRMNWTCDFEWSGIK